MNELKIRKCKNCPAEFKPYNSLQPLCFDCAVTKGKADVMKSGKRHQKKALQAWNRETKLRKEKQKTRSAWFSDLQKLVNKYVKIRDKGLPCCTCGCPQDGIKHFDAGHFLTCGAHPELRFELTNIHAQCSNDCNKHHSGRQLEYQEFIINKYGQEHLDWLKGPHPGLKVEYPHIDDIRDEIKNYKKKLKDLIV